MPGEQSTKAERRAARDRVAVYHQACLAELLEYLTEAIDAYHAEELDAFEVDARVHQYHRAAQKLWSFCDGQPVMVAGLIAEMTDRDEHIDWWTRGAPHRHR